MKFSLYELHFIFSEISRVLKPKGLNFFSARNNHDKFFGKGREVDKEIYDITAFKSVSLRKKRYKIWRDKKGLKYSG
jgi:hypothetical protein